MQIRLPVLILAQSLIFVGCGGKVLEGTSTTGNTGGASETTSAASKPSPSGCKTTPEVLTTLDPSLPYVDTMVVDETGIVFTVSDDNARRMAGEFGFRDLRTIDFRSRSSTTLRSSDGNSLLDPSILVEGASVLFVEPNPSSTGALPLTRHVMTMPRAGGEPTLRVGSNVEDYFGVGGSAGTGDLYGARSSRGRTTFWKWAANGTRSDYRWRWHDDERQWKHVKLVPFFGGFVAMADRTLFVTYADTAELHRVNERESNAVDVGVRRIGDAHRLYDIVTTADGSMEVRAGSCLYYDGGVADCSGSPETLYRSPRGVELDHLHVFDDGHIYFVESTPFEGGRFGSIRRLDGDTPRTVLVQDHAPSITNLAFDAQCIYWSEKSDSENPRIMMRTRD